MFSLYYPEEGRFSEPMSYGKAKRLQLSFYWATIVNIKTGEIVN